jgi:spermidine/putrescine transport system ATP-binding protein
VTDLAKTPASGSRPTRLADAAPLIQLRGIHKHFGDYHALRGIDLEIRQGEFFSLLGPSGCGKTTLLRTIAGFEAPSSGSLLIDGRDMAGVPANHRPTNMVFQSYAIFPHLSVAENVGFGLRRDPRSSAEKVQAVSEALEMVGLGGYGNRAAHALSGGQRQRVALARALILKPKVLLLDEPLSALDKKMREQMQVELIRLQRSVGITFILVTHDQEEALVMSDRIAVMFEGKIGQMADPETLYRRPNSRRVAEFIGKMNLLPGAVAREGDRIVVEVAGLGRGTVEPDQAPGGVIPGPTTFGVRPETLSILFSGEEPPGRFAEGVVDEVVYYGDMTYYDVRVPGIAEPLTISMKNLIGRPVLDVGTPTRVAWDERSLVVLSH